MVHQPSQNVLIVEIEKEVRESAFNHLSQQNSGKVFLEPDRVMMERYVLRQPNSIIVTRLITQSPRKVFHGFPYPKLEKILADISMDTDKYFFFQGEELVHIFENAFSSVWVNEKTLFRYASRREASLKLRHFINVQTRIELLEKQEK